MPRPSTPRLRGISSTTSVASLHGRKLANGWRRSRGAALATDTPCAKEGRRGSPRACLSFQPKDGSGGAASRRRRLVLVLGGHDRWRLALVLLQSLVLILDRRRWRRSLARLDRWQLDVGLQFALGV